MSEVIKFKQAGAVVNTSSRELSPLAKSMSSVMTSRRLQTNTNGTFKRIVNGEQVGDAVRGSVDVIIINALPKVSRIFYKNKYDPDAVATLPDCWSNLGDKPEAASANPQSSNCLDCNQNVKGSGGGDRRACRFQRRIAVLLEGDTSGDIYQFNIPSKSLFGKGVGNVHPFESYVKYLSNNHMSIDAVVTNVSYDLNADTMELQFAPLREVSDDEYSMVQAAQTKPEASSYTKLTVAAVDGVTKQPEAPKPKMQRSEEPEDDEEPKEPIKRSKKTGTSPVSKQDMSSILDDWKNS